MFFFFKQKTAYEMRISDWSSDVCSSELRSPEHSFLRPDRRAAAQGIAHLLPPLQRHAFGQPARHLILHDASLIRRHGRQSALTTAGGALPSPSRCANICRSEEHTSELQSLMRISYAVFCLKKKKNTITTTIPP